jgi:hypothetical protein
MSRSFKKRPFQAICGGGSAKHDKQLAARGMRRRQNQALRTADDFEDFLIPHRYECAFNETYCWGRDGSQMYQGLDAGRTWHYYGPDGCLWDGQWPPKWYQKMMRK